MSNCPAIDVSGITPEKYRSLLAAAHAQGLDLSGETGSTHYQGLEFAWSFDAAAQTLSIRCMGKPIFVPCSVIEQRIRSLIQSSGL